MGRIVRPSDLRRTLFHLMNQRRLSTSTPLSQVYLNAVMESPSVARARQSGEAGPVADEEAARDVGRENLSLERLEMDAGVMAVELDAMFRQLQSYENYHHCLGNLFWNLIAQIDASFRLLQDAYVADVRSARRFFRDNHPMFVQEDHDFIMTRSSVDQVAAAIADALERGPGFDVEVDVIGSRADGQRRGNQFVRRFHYAQTAPVVDSAGSEATVRITSSPVRGGGRGRGRRQGRGASTSGHVARPSSAFSTQAGDRHRRSSSHQRGMMVGGRRVLSTRAGDDGRRVGGLEERRGSSPSNHIGRVSSTGVVRPRDRQSAARGGRSASRGGRGSSATRIGATDQQRRRGGDSAARRDQAVQRPQSSQPFRSSQTSNRLSSDRGRHERRHGAVATAAAAATSGSASRGAGSSSAVHRQTIGTLTGDSTLHGPSNRRPCALGRAMELRELLTGVESFDIDEEVRRRERVVRRPDAAVERAVSFAEGVRRGVVGRLNAIQSDGWLSCDDAREEARLRVVREEDEALAAAAATAAAVSASAAAISASTAASAAAVSASRATSAATSAISTSTANSPGVSVVTPSAATSAANSTATSGVDNVLVPDSTSCEGDDNAVDGDE